jgi:CBS domain containing-hemolysin-like protein
MKPSPVRFFGALALAAALTMFGLAVLAGAWLRETPSFWRNAGGYPVALRHLVLVGFYPALVIYFFSLIFGSVVGWQLLRARHRSGGILLLACALNWLLFFAITAVVLWNNVDNIMNGRPLHYHAP